MPDAVVDTGPLIHLDEIFQLDLLLAVFLTLHIPDVVVACCTKTALNLF